MKVLIFGQSGAGKTTLCKQVVERLGDRAVHINADEMRKEANDWDFSEAGRWRQFRRMVNKANAVSESGKIALVDFICPFASAREQFDADLTIFMGTIQQGRFEDTNAVFQNPPKCDYHVSEWFDDTHQVLLQVIQRYMEDQN